MKKKIRAGSLRDEIIYNEKFIYPLSYKGKNVALIYPNTYYIASSNLGFQTILKLLNNIGFTINRYFIKNKKVFSPDSKLSLSEYNLIFVSISYENDFLNLIDILIAHNINLFSSERDRPKIIIGGAAPTINPFLYAYIANYVFLGEGEVIDEYEDIFNKSIEHLILKKNDEDKIFLKRGFIYSKINKLTNNNNFGHTIYLTSNTVFSNYFLVEITRGCLYNCHFCNYSTISHPYRVMNIENVYNLISKGLKYTNNIGLVSAVLPEYKFLDKIFKRFGKDVNYHFSSLRVDSIDENFFKIIQEFNLHSLTLAPETGDDKLRKNIGKNFTNEQIFNLIRFALKNNINKFKFYFILGLEENDEDYIIEFFKLLKSKIKKNINIMISINPLIPKPMAILGKNKYMSEDVYNNKLKILKKSLFKIGRIKIEFLSYKEGLIQYILSNYSKKIIPALIKYNKNNNRLLFLKEVKNSIF